MSDMHFFWLLIFAVAALMAAFHHLEKNKKDWSGEIMRKEFELSSIIQPAQSMDEELERTILGCMAISAVNPLRFIVQEDQTVAIYAGRRLLTQMNIGLFARLSPQEILREVGIPINDMAAKA